MTSLPDPSQRFLGGGMVNEAKEKKVAVLIHLESSTGSQTLISR
jgi:hypothetical protein